MTHNETPEHYKKGTTAMWKTIEKISQANLDHYNDHPKGRNAIAVTGAAAFVGGIVVAAKKLSESHHRPSSNIYNVR